MVALNTSRRTAIATLAVALFAVSGAAVGSTVGKSPILTRDADAAAPPAIAMSAPEYRPAQERAPLPNHYPLVTPEGTVPVGELGLRGRYHADNGGWWDESDYYPDEASAAGPSDAEIEQLAQAEMALPSQTAARQAAAHALDTAADLATAPQPAILIID